VIRSRLPGVRGATTIVFMKKFASAMVLGVFAFGAVSAHADSFAERCPDISSCAKVVSQLLGQKYVFDDDVKGKFGATANTEITKENAEVLFTSMLYANG